MDRFTQPVEGIKVLKRTEKSWAKNPPKRLK